MEHEILTVEEVCDTLRLGKTSVYELLRSGQLKSLRVGRKWMIPRWAIEDFLKLNVSR